MHAVDLPTNPHWTRELAQFVAETHAEDLPSGIIEQAKLLLLDAIGVGLIGSETAAAPAYLRAFKRVGRGDEATILGFRDRAPAFVASLANASFIHQTEFGEGVERAVVHTSSAVVPAALAVGEQIHASGGSLLRSIALGCEALIRFGYAIATDPDLDRPGVVPGDRPISIEVGWMPPDLLSPLGSATVASVLHELSADQLHDAWGLAANAAPATVLAMLKDGLTGRGFFMGIGTATGLLAADLAREGIHGMRDIVADWMPVIVPKYDPRRLTADLGKHYEFGMILYKHFSVVGPIFSPLEATFVLVDAYPDLDPLAIKAVTVYGYQRTVMNARPVPPQTAEGARSNVAYCVARALVSRDREVFIRDAFQPEALTDPLVTELGRKVHVIHDARYEQLYPHVADLSRVVIEMEDGRCVEREVDLRKIPKYHRPERSDIEAKFWHTSSRRLARPAAERLVSAIASCEHLSDVNELTAILRE